jgi:hypothetical protein
VEPVAVQISHNARVVPVALEVAVRRLTAAAVLEQPVTGTQAEVLATFLAAEVAVLAEVRPSRRTAVRVLDPRLTARRYGTPLVVVAEKLTVAQAVLVVLLVRTALVTTVVRLRLSATGVVVEVQPVDGDRLMAGLGSSSSAMPALFNVPRVDRSRSRVATGFTRSTAPRILARLRTHCRRSRR